MDQFRNALPTSRKDISIGAILSYIFDYAIIIALAIVYAEIDVLVKPFHQHFALQNYTIQYPYAVHERIPIHNALLISGAFPAVVIIVYTLIIDGIFSHRRKSRGYFHTYTFKDRVWELNCGILGLFLAQGAAFVITGTLKNLCGKPRPDLIDRCQPSLGSIDPVPFGLSNSSICTQTDQAILTDGFRSFPSGHSSSSFAGLFYLSLYLAGKLHVLDQRGEVWRTLIVLIPTLAASCVAMSRIMDARHHPFDVLFGSALGILVAWASYRQYFSSVSDSWEKGRAYPMRTWGKMTRKPLSLSRPADVATGDPGGVDDVPGESQIALTSMMPPEGRSPEGSGAGTGNVFRDQVSQSTRTRMQQQQQRQDGGMLSSYDEEYGQRYPHPQQSPQPDQESRFSQ